MPRITNFIVLCLLGLLCQVLSGCQPINTAWTSPLIHGPVTAPSPYFLNPAAVDQLLTAYQIAYQSNWSPHMVNGMTADENLLFQTGYRQTTGAFPFDAYALLEMLINRTTNERMVMSGEYLLGERFYQAMMGHGGSVARNAATPQMLASERSEEIDAFYNLPLAQLVQQSSAQTPETLDDLATIRYALTNTQAATALLPIPGLAPGTYELDTVQFDLWVAVDGGYVVKYDVEVAGRVDDPAGFDTFGWNAHYAVSSINKPFVIELAPALQADLDRQQQTLATGEATYPGCPDCIFPLPFGTQISARSMVDLVGVCPPLMTVEAVMAFYQEQLPAYGWVIEQIDGQRIQVVKGDRAFTLQLQLNSDLGKELVLILFIPG